MHGWCSVKHNKRQENIWNNSFASDDDKFKTKSNSLHYLYAKISNLNGCLDSVLTWIIILLRWRFAPAVSSPYVERFRDEIRRRSTVVSIRQTLGIHGKVKRHVGGNFYTILNRIQAEWSRPNNFFLV